MAKLVRDKLHADERRSRQHETLGQVWWKRLWVIQEFGVARRTPTVCVGPHTISWDFLKERLWSNGEWHLFHDLRDQQQPQSLRNFLLNTANAFYCTEPRDWIYALLGLVDDVNKPTPDYSKPVSEVYEEAMVYLVKAERTIDVLLDDRNERAWSYPSWVPRFSEMRDPMAIRTQDRFRAGYDQPIVDLVSHPAPEVLCPCSTHHALSLRAIPFDNVKQKVDMRKLSKATSVLKEALKQFDIDFQQPRRHLVDRAPHIGYLMLEFIFAGKLSVLKTFEHAREELGGIAGVSWVPKMHFPEQLAAEFKFDYNREVKLDMAVATTFEDDFRKVFRSKHGEKRRFKNKYGEYTVQHSQQDRVYFSTESGYAGLGPGSLDIGDSIIVPFGASRPLVVRGHGDHFVLVGDAVVPGIMSGQLVDLHRDGTLQDGVFLLK
ncbi:hypothetical protein LTR36_008277 [Oleoguttula mirabilis]|uniref:Heterokaryon incompatibility domain-containing protein n=1 Tax=Oleoguttula mirabilis TaxID=1507867 RepID=A0AAV9J8T8_9PEZI|nr:hypothetical protein LTR36_008277 [Oleoguttula mirabilis]